MKKELRPFHDHVTCEVCGRTILKGERTEAYLAPGGERHGVCELCFVRAEHAGWIRESAHDQLPARGPAPARSAGRCWAACAGDPRAGTRAEPEPEPAPGRGRSRRRRPTAATAPPPRRARAPAGPAPRARRAHHRRGEGGARARSLQRVRTTSARSPGSRAAWAPPWATAMPDPDAPSTVTVLVAWELSWYRYRVDLGDAAEPVSLQGKGDELGDIDEPLRDWNAELDSDGQTGDRSRERMIYCVVPQALEDELLEKLTDYYSDDPNVEVIVDRRAQGGDARHARPAHREAAPAGQGHLPADRAHDLPEGRRPRGRRGAGEPGPGGGGGGGQRAPTAASWPSATPTSARRPTTSPSTGRCCSAWSSPASWAPTRSRW